MRIHSKILALAFVVASLFGCAASPPEGAYSATSTADRAWSAALGALDEVGVQVTSSDRSAGRIRGTRNGVEVAISVIRQPDGRTRVQFDAKGAKARDPELPGRFLEAYERRMER